MKLQVTSHTGIYVDGKRLQSGDVFEVKGTAIPRVYQGSVRVVGEEIVPQSKAKKGHVLLRVIGGAAIYWQDKKYVTGDILEVPEAHASRYSNTIPADQPMPVSGNGHAPMHVGGGFH